MPKEKGSPKTGGRQKGSRNLRTLVLRESLDRVGFDVVQELKNLYPILDPAMQAKVLMSFMPYLFPRPEAVTIERLRTVEMEKAVNVFEFDSHLDGNSAFDLDADDEVEDDY